MPMFSGVFCALWTPTDRHGEVEWDEWDRLLTFVLRAGAHGIMALGSTGEFPQLPLSLRQKILERTVEHCRREGGRPVLANVSDISCRNAVQLARHARETGAAAAAVLPPWFFPLEQRDLVEFFVAVGREGGLPLGLYNFPEVTGQRITLETVRAVCARTPVAVVKQSGAEFGYHERLLALGSELGFAVMTGADTRLEEALDLGCTGTVSGLANAWPDLLSGVFDRYQAGQRSPREMQFIRSVSSAIAGLQFPHNISATIAARGFDPGWPKNPVSAQTEAMRQQAIEQLVRLAQQCSNGLNSFNH